MEPGEELGREVTRRGWILLTGGELRQRVDVLRNNGEVKEAAMIGAAAAQREGLAARLIGILPDRPAAGKPCWHRPSQHRLFLGTGLAHNIRNVINGRTPDVLVAFGGSRGTMAEMAFAIAAGRQVLVHRGFARLLRNFDAYFGQNAKPKYREVYLAARCASIRVPQRTLTSCSHI
jgi:predicted Rossmann-fold nucleotide-binding protein